MKSLFTLTRNEPERKVFGMSFHSQGENVESGLLSCSLSSSLCCVSCVLLDLVEVRWRFEARATIRLKTPITGLVFLARMIVGLCIIS